jgi:hypothetical protein
MGDAAAQLRRGHRFTANKRPVLFAPAIALPGLEPQATFRGES